MSEVLPGGSSPTPSEQLSTDYADLRDGQLQIVEVTPFDKSEAEDDGTETIHIHTEEGSKYMQVLDSDGKGLMQLDLLNLTLVRCGDGEGEEYRLVTKAESQECGDDFITSDTVILQSSDADDGEDAQESYVMVEGENDAQESYIMVEGENEQEERESYVMVEAAGGPVLCLQSDLQPAHVNNKQVNETEKPATTMEILERAKALHKAKTLLKQTLEPQTGRGRRRKHQLPSASEILASPNFKLFLYNCKQCHFKCNAISELTKHRSSVHASGTQKYRRLPSSTLQCARCPYRVATHYQLMRHIQDNHMKQAESDSEEGSEVLVCGACGFESSSRQTFREHIEAVHTQSTTLPPI